VRLLNEPKPAEAKQQAIFDAARNFAEAATRIDDAASQLRALSDQHNGEIPSDSADLARLQADLKQTQDSIGRRKRNSGGSLECSKYWPGRRPWPCLLRAP